MARAVASAAPPLPGPAVDPGSAITQMAQSTIDSPGAQRWMPEMVANLRKMVAQTNAQPGNHAVAKPASGAEKQIDDQLDDQLEKCARRCVEIAAGQHNDWNGQYIGRNETADEWR